MDIIEKNFKKRLFLLLGIVLMSFGIFVNVGAVSNIDSSSIARMEELKNNNEELADYVDHLEEKYGKDFVIDLSAESKMDDVPLLLQWDERWGYKAYGSGLIGYTGCGPTCLSMIALYFTGNDEYSPLYTAKLAMDKGYYVWGVGTAWALFEEGAKDLGLSCRNVTYTENSMKERLDAGEKLVCSMRPGDFTKGGHFLIVKGYTEEGFEINDPNSRIKSEKIWSPDVFLPQVKQMWTFKKAE